MSDPLPVRIAVQPVAQAWVGRPVHMRFANSGTLTVRVQASSVVLDTSNHRCVSHAMPAVKVTPSAFTVKPYGGQTVTVTVPGSGAHDYGVLFIANAAGSGHKSVTVQAAVGSQVTTGGHLTCGDKLAEQAPVSHSLINPLGAVILAVVVLGTVLAITAEFLRRRYNHRKGTTI